MKEYQITFTEEECAEIYRALLNQTTFHLKDLQKEAADAGDYKRVACLQHMKDICMAAIVKLPVKLWG